ncbi:MAG: GNAT family N-acetyltransferase [Pseudomonadota bacterium]
MIIETERLRLCRFQPRHREPFARMSADPVVMADLGGPIDRTGSDAKIDRYVAALKKHGFSRWAVENRHGDFLGYTGVMAHSAIHTLGFHHEIGWRFKREAWGHGYATEAAKAALEDAFERLGLPEVIAYTSADNQRSQSVMRKLGLLRDPSRDFVMDIEGGAVWRGLVWLARQPDSR